MTTKAEETLVLIGLLRSDKDTVYKRDPFSDDAVAHMKKRGYTYDAICKTYFNVSGQMVRPSIVKQIIGDMP